ncbi:hypothetical protein [Aquimarina sp. AU474]|uniref:hypothetical protein n=1 Tax=Aquimarina sp. AU474 TaxID=2108529 RepID=UPI000D6983E7|nr:hypothetical protein [Aquimarina sp. AU474]
MNKQLTYILIALLLKSIIGIAQSDSEQIKFHQIKITASSIHPVKFNISDTSNVPFVQEIIDNNGRTQEIRFYNSLHKLTYAGSGFYGGPIIRYDYLDNKIVETYYSGENEIANDFKTSEVPYRSIYHLNENNQIESIEIKYKMEFEWTTNSLDETIKHLELYKKYVSEVSELNSVFGYAYASGKLNGENPKRKK